MAVNGGLSYLPLIRGDWLSGTHQTQTSSIDSRSSWPSVCLSDRRNYSQVPSTSRQVHWRTGCGPVCFLQTPLAGRHSLPCSAAENIPGHPTSTTSTTWRPRVGWLFYKFGRFIVCTDCDNFLPCQLCVMRIDGPYSTLRLEKMPHTCYVIKSEIE